MISWCCSYSVRCFCRLASRQPVLSDQVGRRKGETSSEPSGHITNIIGRATSLLSGANMFK